MKKPTPTIPAEVPIEYATSHPDRRVPLMDGGDVRGVFVNPVLREQSRQFIVRLRESGGGFTFNGREVA